MKVLGIDRYRDGGTDSIKTDEGEFCIDSRIGSPNRDKCVLFRGHPSNGNEIINQEELKKDLIESLESFKPTDQQGRLKYHILDLLKIK